MVCTRYRHNTFARRSALYNAMPSYKWYMKNLSYLPVVLIIIKSGSPTNDNDPLTFDALEFILKNLQRNTDTLLLRISGSLFTDG